MAVNKCSAWCNQVCAFLGAVLLSVVPAIVAAQTDRPAQLPYSSVLSPVTGILCVIAIAFVGPVAWRKYALKKRIAAENRFADIQNHLSSSEPLVRANAVLCLGEFIHTSETYFQQIVTRLATILHVKDIWLL